MKNTKVHHTNMKEEDREHNSPSANILTLPYYLLIVCGQTLSTDGATVSRRMVVYSSAIYILDLILLFRNVTCFDKDDDFDSSEVAEKLGSVIFQITLQILLSITLCGSAKKFPAIIKKLEKLEITIGDRSLQREIQTSLKRLTMVGLVCSITLGIGLVVFKFIMAMNTWENCPKHRWFFSSKNQHEHVMRFLSVGCIFPGFQVAALLTFCVSLSNVVAIYFKYLREQLATRSAEHQLDIESAQVSRCSEEQIHRIRLLFEHTCELTTKVDDGTHLIVGTHLLFEIPMICLFTYNAFVPEFRLDLLFYSLVALTFCLINLVATTHLNWQVNVRN